MAEQRPNDTRPNAAGSPATSATSASPSARKVRTGFAPFSDDAHSNGAKESVAPPARNVTPPSGAVVATMPPARVKSSAPAAHAAAANRIASLARMVYWPLTVTFSVNAPTRQHGSPALTGVP